MKKFIVRLSALAMVLIMCFGSFACGSKEGNDYLGVLDYIIDGDSVLRLNAETAQERLDALAVGDTVTLGTYNLDNDETNGNESLTWKVLAVENGKALIISELCIDASV